uniref:Uncharacterized protein n=1 Tax=Anguilla anguilla TaxID=7936 RepID=A0A0E9RHP4_ANGAN
MPFSPFLPLLECPIIFTRAHKHVLPSPTGYVRLCFLSHHSL